MKTFYLILSFLFFTNLAFSQDFQKFYSLGNEYAQKGNYQKAINNFKKAEKAAEKKYEKNRVYKALADNYYAISEYTNAITYYEKLLKIYNDEDKKIILLNLSELWVLTGQYQKVIDNLRYMQNCPDETVRLNNLSAAYFRLGKSNDAISFLDSVLTNKQLPNYKIALQNKGYIYWRLHKNQEAEKILEEAVMLFDSRDGGKYICLANLALVKSENGKHDDALKYINSAVEWQKEHLGKRNQDYIISLRKKAEILFKAGKTADAATHFKEFFYAEKEYIARNFMYMTEQERLNFWHTVKFQIDKCYQIENEDAAFLFDIALFQKNVLTLANINFYQIASDNENYDILLELRAKSLTAETAQERTVIERQASEVEKELVGSFAVLKDFQKALKLSTPDINKTLKNKNDVAVEFVYYCKNDTMRYAAVVLQKDGDIKFVPMFTKEEIENYPIGFSTLLDNILKDKNGANMIYYDTFEKDENVNHLPEFLWNKVLNATDLKQNSNIYFVPDGIFYQLAVEYLCPRTDLKLYRLSSMRVLAEKHQMPDYNNALLIGAVDYDDASKADTVIMPDRTGSSFCKKGFVFLKESKGEILNAKSNLKIKYKDMLMGNQATEEKVKKKLPQYKTVVFSTHGYSMLEKKEDKINESFTDRSSQYNSMAKCGIALSGINVLKDTAYYYYFEDGLLTAIEFSRLDLSNVDLIVFSACQTNVGVITYNGIYNLPRSLKKAGVGSVISTLWEVDSEKTAVFMSLFFKQLRLGKTKYEALKYAQTQMKTKEACKQALYWAPFILIDGLN